MLFTSILSIKQTDKKCIKYKSNFYLLMAQAEQEHNTQMRGNHFDFYNFNRKLLLKL